MEEESEPFERGVGTNAKRLVRELVPVKARGLPAVTIDAGPKARKNP